MNINYKPEVDKTHLDNTLRILREYIKKQKELDAIEDRARNYFRSIGVPDDAVAVKDKIKGINEVRLDLKSMYKHQVEEQLAVFADSLKESERKALDTSFLDQNALFLMEKGLYETPEQLEYLQKEQADKNNLLMLRLISKYAKEKGWDGFDVIPDVKQYKNAISMAKDAASGVFGMLDGYQSAFVQKYDTADKFIDFYKDADVRRTDSIVIFNE